MKIEFSLHSKERIRSRKISVVKVLDTIQNPKSQKLSFRGRKLLQKRYGDKILEVVTKAEKGKIIIVTAYYLTNKNEIKIRQKN